MAIDLSRDYLASEKDLIEIHTSDRQSYKRCRRRFGWGSTLRDNLVRIGPDQKAFFIGTGFHFAFEDWWGYRRFSHPALAFAAYYDAHKQKDLPEDADEALDLVTGMLEYYVDEWDRYHPEDYETLWIDGVPQVEVHVKIDVTELLLQEAEDRGYREQVEEWLDGKAVVYVTTYDRVVIDRYERLWGLDYKTAGNFDELNLQTNPQAAAYNWSMDLFYSPTGYEPEGIIWQQHRKMVPKEPRILKSGLLSTDKDQLTTYYMYKQALVAKYGRVPGNDKYQAMLAELAKQEDDEGNRFIRRDRLRLNEAQRRAEQTKIVQEVLEMLDPDLPLYPNPTKDCGWDCPFKEPCLALDGGEDYQHLLDEEFVQWAGYKDDWRSRVKYPDADSKPTLTLVKG